MRTPFHTDLADFESKLRQPLPEFTEKQKADAMLMAQVRSREVGIQFALWVMSEINDGTSPSDLANATGLIIGNMASNVAEHIGRADSGASVDTACEILAVATLFVENREEVGKGSIKVNTSHKTTRGGNA